MKNILKVENIITGLNSITRQEAIQMSGNMMLDNSFITERYIEGMFSRDEELSTYIGNHIAIPHGEYEYKEEVLNTGLTMLVIPEGIEWHGEDVKIVIGIAAKNNEHLDIISNIAIKLSDMDVVDQLLTSEPHEILEILTTED